MSKLLLALMTAAGLAVTLPAAAADAPAKADTPMTKDAAPRMSRDAHKAEVDRINAAYKADKARCDAMKGNAEDICEAEVKGKRDVAKAEAEAAYKNTAKAREDAKVAKGNADYNVAKEKCDDLSGNQKDVCVKDAKAALTRVKADAHTERVASEKPRDSGRVAEAKREAADDKRDAQYKAAVERCDAMSGDAKDACVRSAKTKFGKT